MTGLYIHIPFCASRCVYCGFYSTTLPALRDAYVDALCQELMLRAEELPADEALTTIYLGGGTPSQLTTDQLDRLFSYIYKVYRKKLQKQKAVARGFIENKEGWAAELNHLDESDRYFMDRFKKKILENMGNADMKMDDLGAQMLLSKVQLYRKVKAMTGKTPAELLKEMRLQRAYTLLMQTDKTVAEVSAEVGFALPGYFSSCFKKQYGVLPTDLRHKPV